MVLPCQCKHECQDKLYGNGNRVHTSCIKGYRCTVCLNIVAAGNQQKKEEK